MKWNPQQGALRCRCGASHSLGTTVFLGLVCTSSTGRVGQVLPASMAKHVDSSPRAERSGSSRRVGRPRLRSEVSPSPYLSVYPRGGEKTVDRRQQAEFMPSLLQLDLSRRQIGHGLCPGSGHGVFQQTKFKATPTTLPCRLPPPFAQVALRLLMGGLSQLPLVRVAAASSTTAAQGRPTANSSACQCGGCRHAITDLHRLLLPHPFKSGLQPVDCLMRAGARGRNIAATGGPTPLAICILKYQASDTTIQTSSVLQLIEICVISTRTTVAVGKTSANGQRRISHLANEATWRVTAGLARLRHCSGNRTKSLFCRSAVHHGTPLSRR